MGGSNGAFMIKGVCVGVNWFRGLHNNYNGYDK